MQGHFHGVGSTGTSMTLHEGSVGSQGTLRTTGDPPKRRPREGGDPEGDGLAKRFFVYIMASRRNGTLYVGVTSNLTQRVWQHKESLADGFTSQYGVKTLVYFEAHETAESAITREKQIKKWRRAWKLRLIEERNPEWNDLAGLL